MTTHDSTHKYTNIKQPASSNKNNSQRYFFFSFALASLFTVLAGAAGFVPTLDFFGGGGASDSLSSSSVDSDTSEDS
jgi:hypothetical protein